MRINVTPVDTLRLLWPWKLSQNINRVTQSHDHNRPWQVIKGKASLKVLNNEDIIWPYTNARDLLTRSRDIAKTAQTGS